MSLLDEVDTAVIVILVGKFYFFKTLCADIDIWVAFGVGKYCMYSHINYTFHMLGEDKCLPLPVFHSFTGCDTRLHQLSLVVVKKWHDKHGIVMRT